MSVLVEVHDEQELERALRVDIDLMGINNRDLHVFETDLQTSLKLAPLVPNERLVVSESGIHTPDDVAMLQAGGVGAFLIGESLMRQPDPGQALKRLFD
jgi:indole-3-glycerol phosphate synthase